MHNNNRICVVLFQTKWSIECHFACIHMICRAKMKMRMFVYQVAAACEQIFYVINTTYLLLYHNRCCENLQNVASYDFQLHAVFVYFPGFILILLLLLNIGFLFGRVFWTIHLLYSNIASTFNCFNYMCNPVILVLSSSHHLNKISYMPIIFNATETHINVRVCVHIREQCTHD